MSDLKQQATEELLSALWDEYGPGDIQEGEFTVMGLKELKGCSYDVAKHTLDKALEAGAVTRRRMGARGWAYKYTIPTKAHASSGE